MGGDLAKQLIWPVGGNQAADPCALLLETSSVSVLGVRGVSGDASSPCFPLWAENSLKEGTGSHPSSPLLWAQQMFTNRITDCRSKSPYGE